MCHSEPGPEAVEITTVASPQVPQSDLPSKRHNNKRTLTTEFIILTDNIPNQNSNNSSRKPDKSPNQERAMRKSVPVVHDLSGTEEKTLLKGGDKRTIEQTQHIMKGGEGRTNT